MVSSLSLASEWFYFGSRTGRGGDDYILAPIVGETSPVIPMGIMHRSDVLPVGVGWAYRWGLTWRIFWCGIWVWLFRVQGQLHRVLVSITVLFYSYKRNTHINDRPLWAQSRDGLLALLARRRYPYNSREDVRVCGGFLQRKQVLRTPQLRKFLFYKKPIWTEVWSENMVEWKHLWEVA